MLSPEKKSRAKWIERNGKTLNTQPRSISERWDWKQNKMGDIVCASTIHKKNTDLWTD
jgi:hypothetical protein